MTQEEMKVLKEQIKAELLAEQEAIRRNRDVWRRVQDEFAAEIEKLNWTYEWHSARPDGTPYDSVIQQKEVYRITQSLGTLVRATLRAKTIRGLPALDEEKVRRIMRGVLDVLLNEKNPDIISNYSPCRSKMNKGA